MKIYYVNLQRPWCVILEVEATLVTCEKFTWAVDQRGARRLLGASAFFTVTSAERAKIGALMRLVKPMIAAKVPHVYEVARTELLKHNEGYRTISADRRRGAYRGQFTERSR